MNDRTVTPQPAPQEHAYDAAAMVDLRVFLARAAAAGESWRHSEKVMVQISRTPSYDATPRG